MARIPFFSKGVVYDTTHQVVQLGQVVEYFSLGQTLPEKCVISEVFRDERGEFRYTMIGLKSLLIHSTRFVFSDRDTAIGAYADLAYPVFMAPERVKELAAHAAVATEARRRAEERKREFLHRGVEVVDYSERCLVIFTSDPNDVVVLERIRAKRNSGLVWQGRKRAGWIFPKCRQAQLAAVMTL